MEAMQSRAGRTMAQASGYLAYVPAPLPPHPALVLDGEAIDLLSRTDHALGKLDGIATLLPNPDLFVGMYVRKEALLSSQIEGIDSTLDQVIRFEQGEEPSDGKRLHDTAEVVNYVRALNYGIKRLAELPLSLRLIREIHAELMRGVRGEGKAPGEFRVTQNWIGARAANLASATFVPPPVPEMKEALDNFEKFLHERRARADRAHYPLDEAAMLIAAHAYPDLDVAAELEQLDDLARRCPGDELDVLLEYLFGECGFTGNRLEYYDRLTAVRTNGDWEGWMKFFLRGAEQTGLEAVQTAKKVIAFREDAVRTATGLGANELKLIEFLFGHPLTDIQTAQKQLGVSYNTAASAIARLEKANLLKETTGRQRNRIFRFAAYLDLFESPAERVAGHKQISGLSDT